MKAIRLIGVLIILATFGSCSPTGGCGGPSDFGGCGGGGMCYLPASSSGKTSAS